MFIKSLTYGTIEYVRKNNEKIFNDLKDSTINLEEYLIETLGINFNEKSKFINPRINFIKNNTKDPKSTDFKNSKLIYNAFKNLTKSQASDIRLWAGYAINDDVYDYLKFRWGDTDKTILYRIVSHSKGKRGLVYHGIARLWWFAHLTYLEEENDQYELTEFIFNYPHIMEKMIYRNFSNSNTIRLGVIRGIKKFIENGGEYKTEKLDSLYKQISLISGINLLDVIPECDIVDISFKFLNTLE